MITMRIATLALCLGTFAVAQSIAVAGGTKAKSNKQSISDQASSGNLTSYLAVGGRAGGKQSISDQSSTGGMTSYRNNSRTGGGKQSISDQGSSGNLSSFSRVGTGGGDGKPPR